MSISRILIIGDPLRPNPGDPSQSGSTTFVRCFRDLLTAPLSAVTDLPVELLTDDFPGLYRDSGLVPSTEAWATLYAGDLSQALQERLLRACRDAFVIGIEMPPSIARLLTRHDVPFLDCVVDPLRFLDDLALTCRTHIAAIRQALAPFAVPAFDVRRAAARITAKTRWLPPPAIPDGATLVLDQLPLDAALIDPRRGRHVDWEDYRAELTALKQDGPVIWRAHPYRPDGGLLADILGADARTTTNFYQLVSDDRLARVVAISSGGVVEARAFGKAGVHFLDRYAGIELEGWANPTPVVGHWLSPHFWREILAPLAATRREVPEQPVVKNAFRSAIDADWDFGWIDQTVVRNRGQAKINALETSVRELETYARGLESRIGVQEARIDDLTGRLQRHDEQLSRLRSVDHHRLGSRIAELVQSARRHDWRVGVFGAGEHTSFLLRETVLAQAPRLLLFDSNPNLRGGTVDGRTVHAPDEIPSMGLDAIVVSSLAYQDEIAAYLRSLPLNGTRIVLCYA
jgi:hypothetical protein